MFPGPVCLSFAPRKLQEVLEASAEGADCIEVRLDYLEDVREVHGFRWDRLAKPAIATCRGTAFGGRFDGSSADEVALLDNALARGAAWIDVDYRLTAELRDPGRAIASFHSFEETPANLEAILREARGQRTAAVKIATTCNTWRDVRALMDLLRQPGDPPLIIAGMGEIGQLTRILGPAHGSALTFVSPGTSDALKTAPGQLTIEELLTTFRFRKLRQSTRVFGVLGFPVSHSLSPQIQNRGFDQTDFDGVYVRLPAPDLDDFFQNARSLGIEGLSVTIPHKTAVLKFLSDLTPEAREVGAVNTVFTSGGQWHGDNTDVEGVREAFRSVLFDPAGKTIVILGSGGAARAAAAASKQARDVIVLSRRTPHGDWPGRVRFDRLDRVAAYRSDLLINATPVGMHGSGTPVHGSIPTDIVFDMVYTPAFTPLLRDAMDQGKLLIRGTTMFLAQAARQFQRWTGHPLPLDAQRVTEP